MKMRWHWFWRCWNLSILKDAIFAHLRGFAQKVCCSSWQFTIIQGQFLICHIAWLMEFPRAQKNLPKAWENEEQRHETFIVVLQVRSQLLLVISLLWIGGSDQQEGVARFAKSLRNTFPFNRQQQQHHHNHHRQQQVCSSFLPLL